jgi:ribosomal protein S8
VYIKRSKLSSQLLSILQAKGLIISFRKINEANFCVIPRYFFGKESCKIQFFSKNLFLNYTYKSLLRLLKNKGPCVMILYNPWLGIVSHEKVLEKKEGGRLLCIIYY